MMNIAVVDDESAILENIRKCVENEITISLLIHRRRIFSKK